MSQCVNLLSVENYPVPSMSYKGQDSAVTTVISTLPLVSSGIFTKQNLSPSSAMNSSKRMSLVLPRFSTLTSQNTCSLYSMPQSEYMSTRRLSHNRIGAIGSSTVAIDNKIEQAMDLVKSHLMFAVREEVEVLKEQIKELMERTGQLEYENGILRAAASPETLAMLSQPRQQPPSSSS